MQFTALKGLAIGGAVGVTAGVLNERLGYAGQQAKVQAGKEWVAKANAHFDAEQEHDIQTDRAIEDYVRHNPPKGGASISRDNQWYTGHASPMGHFGLPAAMSAVVGGFGGGVGLAIAADSHTLGRTSGGVAGAFTGVTLGYSVGALGSYLLPH